MNGNAAAAPAYSFGHMAAAYLGRNQGPEFFTSISHTFGGVAGAVGQVLVPRNLSLNRPLQALLLRWSGRLVVGVADYTAAAAESPATILQRLTVNGTFKGTSLTPFRISGATANTWATMFGLNSSVYINGVRQPAPTSPYAQTVANFGAQATYDLQVWFVLPTAPIVSPSSRAFFNPSFHWTPQDWADSLQITLEFGDRTAFGTPAGGTTTVFTAFGSAAGTPTLDIFTVYSLMGTLRGSYRSACVVRNENVYTAGMQAIATNQRITQLQKQKTTNILVKTGTILAGSAAGVQVFGALSDLMLDRTQITVDNRPIRNNLSNLASKEWIGHQFQRAQPQGYLLFSFIDSQHPRTAFRADLSDVVGAGADLSLMTDVLTAGATQQVNVVQEQIYADADDRYWGGTR